ncbi:hypothetical protein C7414_102380 [Cupriavidus alkaliphilus]|uniref:hypothetical protein n=1 Tax=Cupriavidus alkaliphilus TaxID=942866 RepID=UPI000DE79E9E|nr:hypothetical protein [Cupriavidus alkaliphilus]PVY81052.1 hypothetical protein C7414_102380 [Cupriavidus alkaliphilus]
MTRALDGTTVAAVTAGHVPYLFFVQLDFSQPLRVCSAGYNIDWNGVTWLGLGSLGSIDPIQEQASLEATGVRLTLTGVPTEYVAIMLAEQYQGRPCQIWFAPLREDLQLGVAPIRMFSGRMDVPAIDVGETASITVSAESKMVAWDRPKTRRYNHEDQIGRYPGDLGFIYTSQMVEKQLVWGR